MSEESAFWFFVWLFLIGFPSAGISALLLRTKRPRFSRLYAILTAILFIIVLPVCGGFFFLSASYAPRPSPPENIQTIGTANLYMITSVPLSITKEQSIDVSTFIDVSPFRLTQVNQGETPSSTELTPVGTPGVSIRDAFGPGYAVSAKAQLSASAFDVDPKEQLEQSLDQNNTVTFSWTATPKYVGKQTLEVTLIGVWTPIGGGIPIERPLAFQSLSLDVSDTPPPPSPPFFSFGQIDLGVLLGVFLGSGLNIPWIIELIKGIRKRRQTRSQVSHLTDNTMQQQLTQVQRSSNPPATNDSGSTRESQPANTDNSSSQS